MEKLLVFQPPAQVRKLMLKKTKPDTVTLNASLSMESGVIVLHYN